MGVGRVSLVGAGPGAADLLTLRALRLLQESDLFIQDRLLPDDFLEQAGIGLAGKELILLGHKSPAWSQNAIHDAMLAAARSGRSVARVKTGDPFVFGRGGEEIEFLSQHGIPVEVVPGVSSVLAGPASACLPLTHRLESRSFAVASARGVGGAVTETWPRADNLVVLMGAAKLAEAAAGLLRQGWPATTPTAVLERVSLPWERRFHAQLDHIGTVCQDAGLRSPAALLVGPAAALRPACRRPLILFTGLDPTHFRHLGDLLHWPALRILPEENPVARLAAVLAALRARQIDQAIFTSRVGACAFFRLVSEAGEDARILAGVPVIAAGAGTAARLAESGIRASAAPDRGGGAGILALAGQPKTCLIVQGSHAPRQLEQELQRRGARIERLALHRIERHPELGRSLPYHDVVYFVSPSGVRACWETYGPAAFQQEIWCIGDVTQAEVTRLGFQAKIVGPHD